MAIGKSKKTGKGGKRGGKKKIADAFSRKEWYDIRAPATFKMRDVGKTPVNRTQGTKLSTDGLRGRVYEACLADLQQDEELAYRKIRLKGMDVSGKSVLTVFNGMDLTTDKLRSLVRKWHTTIEAHANLKTSDDYLLSLFCIGFTRRRPNQLKKTCYAQHSQVRQIRAKMLDIIQKEVETSTLRELVEKLIPEAIGKKIEKECKGIFPLQNVFIRKVKVLKAPKLDMHKLMEYHSSTTTAPAATAPSTDAGAKVERPVEAAKESK